MPMARRWSWLIVLVVGLVLFEAVRRAISTTGNPNLVPSLLLLGAAVMPVTFVAFIAGRRLSYAVGGGTIALTALVGGVVGAVTAGLLEFETLHDLGVVPLLAVGIIEEAAKLVLPLALVFLLRPRSLPDGLLVGVASGAGFAVLETMGYAFVTLVQSKGDLAAVDDVLFLRGVLSPAAHMAWTGLTAAALWQAAGHRWQARSVARFLGVYVVAVLLHTAWDSAGTGWVEAAVAAVSLALLAYTVHRLAAAERHGHAAVAGSALAGHVRLD
jgi:RsiW-degrading membrane proteinase PrsW (M82 family)